MTAIDGDVDETTIGLTPSKIVLKATTTTAIGNSGTITFTAGGYAECNLDQRANTDVHRNGGELCDHYSSHLLNDVDELYHDYDPLQ